MTTTTVLGVLLNHRNHSAKEFQDVLTNFGCMIKTRIGLHQAKDGVCSPNGVILLDVIGSDEEILEMENAIKLIPDVQIQKMSFKV